MSINWFEIVIEMVNFLVLIWLLSKFFYQPVLQVMKDRQAQIDQIQAEAGEKMEEANELIKRYVEKNKSLEEREEEIMAEAKQKAQERQESLWADYQKEAEQQRQALLEEVAQEREAFLLKLRQTLGDNALILSERILKKVAGQDLQKVFFEDFLHKLEKLDDALLEDEKKEAHLVTLRSARPLDEEEKTRFRSLLSAKMGSPGQVEYVVEDDFVLGYELQLKAVTISSHLRKYLEESEKNLQQVLQEV